MGFQSLLAFLTSSETHLCSYLFCRVCISKFFPRCTSVSLGWPRPTGDLSALWYPLSIHAIFHLLARDCFQNKFYQSPILELYLCWPLILELYSKVPAPGITMFPYEVSFAFQVLETPYDFLVKALTPIDSPADVHIFDYITLHRKPVGHHAPNNCFVNDAI